ncbi:MAG: MFS transporter [Anaerolinea sp.]|nr:MFS transporter [Anaerolinea sp.]
MTQAPANKGMRAFNIIWIGQLFSLLGSELTGFALGIWVYQNTGSVTQFALISFFTIIPGLVLSPIIGALVDRWNRRRIMIFSDTGAALSTLFIAVLLWGGQLETWHIYLATIITSTLSAFQNPTYMAAITLMVPKKQLGRANGMVQMALAISQLVAPVVAGILVDTIQIRGVILVDFATFLFAILTLLMVRIPDHKPKLGEGEEEEKRSIWQDVVFGWRYITERPGILALLIFFSFAGFLVGIVSVLATPLVLSFASASVLGTVLSISATGMLAGAAAMSALGGLKRHIYGVLGFSLWLGVCLVLVGLRPSAVLVAIGGWAFFFALPIVNASATAIMQIKIEPDVQGRVFAFRRMISGGAIPIAYLISGPLADYIFEPLMAQEGPLAGSVGQIIGTGDGRGIALLFIVAGIFLVVLTAGGFLYQPLRFIEDRLPDVIM